MKSGARIYVAGHRGLVGSALTRGLAARGFHSVLTRSREQLDLRDPAAVLDFFRSEQPEYVFLAAARVGGIRANSIQPADFIRDNLLIQASVIDAAHKAGTRRLLFFGSNCVYPRDCPQPMREDAIHTGPMEPTSEAYSMAKLAGLAMCAAYNRQHGTQFLAVIPPTLYGPGAHFDAETGHVLPALMRRLHEAKARVLQPAMAGAGPGRPERPRVTVWGTGAPVREFLYVDDLADASLFLAGVAGPLPESPINVGEGTGYSIRELAGRIARVVDFDGEIDFDARRPDGAPRKVLDSGRIRALGWSARTTLDDGLRKTYAWFLENRC
jgi:GDP-L-fucose synthase